MQVQEGEEDITNRDKRRDTINRMLIDRYTQTEIAKELGVHRNTVRNEIIKMRKETDRWVDDLAKYTYFQEFRSILEAFDDTIKRCNIGLRDLKDWREEQVQRLNDLYATLPENKPNARVMAVQTMNQAENIYQTARKDLLKKRDESEKLRATVLYQGPMAYSVGKAIQFLRKEGKMTEPVMPILAPPPTEKIKRLDSNE